MTSNHQAASTRSKNSRDRRSALCLLLALALAAPVSAMESIKSYPILTLKDGRQFTAVEIVNYTANGVLVRHANGATTFRLDVLPEYVIAALHLQGWENHASGASDFASLADKPAVADDSSLVDRPAVASTVASHSVDRAAIASHEAVASAPAPAVTLSATPAPAGEGNMPEFFVVQNTIATGSATNHALAGRVVVALPSGETFLLGDVDVRGYPADLLPEYMQEAKAQARKAAQLFRDRAAIAAQEGRLADADTLTARANKTAARYLAYLPEAPVSTRSDEFGNFTLNHSLREIRIVASGQLTVTRGQWNYEWMGVAPAKDAALTEANATAVIAAEANPAKYAAR